MKKINSVKTALLQISFASAILITVSCNNAQKPEDTKEVAEEHNDAKFNTEKQEKDAQFLVNAAEISMEEIQLGQLAQQNGKTTQIRELGKMMEDAHSQSLNNLGALAKSKMMSIPTSPTDNAKNAYKLLNEKSGKDFDKAYVEMMINGHKDAIVVFEKVSADYNDVDIRNWATLTLPELRKHLDFSIDCQKKLEKM